VQDLDRQVLAAFAEDFFDLLGLHLARPVVGVDDVVAELKLDEFDLDLDLNVNLSVIV